MHFFVYMVGNKRMTLSKSRHHAMRESNPSRLVLRKNLKSICNTMAFAFLFTKFTRLDRTGSTLVSSLTNIVLKKTL